MAPDGVVLRPGRDDDVGAVRAVEVAAGEVFRTVGMDTVADDPPPSATVLRGFVDRGGLWVAVVDGRVVGYALGDLVDGAGHLAQLSVHPDAGGRGIGRALLERVADRSPTPALTLTTFTGVPWNGPWYLRLGFRVLTDDELGPGLRAVRTTEIARGLDRWPRAAMRRG